jgi:hypothetical protein
MKGISSDGSARCVDIRFLFPATGIMTIQAGGIYAAIQMTCPSNQILQRLDPITGIPICVNPSITYSCPVGQYVQAINALGTADCGYASNQNACAPGSYISAIDNVGNITCTIPTLSGSCTSPTVAVGVDVNGNILCGTNLP